MTRTSVCGDSTMDKALGCSPPPAGRPRSTPRLPVWPSSRSQRRPALVSAPEAWLLLLVSLLGPGPLAGGALHGGCDLSGGCPGGRPPAPSGCCPAGPGEDCGKAECDADLGYRCRPATGTTGNSSVQGAVCTGKYKLHVTDVQWDRVTLGWDDFKPEGYRHEYILFYRQHTYQQELDAWWEIDIGSDPWYRLTDLAPASLYFLRLAVWADDEYSLLGAMSETIWFTTRAVPFCRHNGQRLAVGTEVTNCEDRCTCRPNGSIECTPLCSALELHDLAAGCSMTYPEDCSCDVVVMCPNQNGTASCQFQGREYSDLDTVKLGCLECTCSGGNMSCQQARCPAPPRPTDDCPNPTHVLASPTDCCPSLICADGLTISTTSGAPTSGLCQYKGDNYADGSSWTDNSSCTTCVCESGHVVCERATCQEPAEPPGCVNARLETDAYGCCEHIVCSSIGSGEEECRHNDSVYRRGTTFTSGCALCVCTRATAVSCTTDSCGTVHPPLPSVLCPFPHTRHNGCCDTVFCVPDNIDPQTFMNRLMVLSFGPHTLTISFDVDDRRAASAGTVTQDRYEVMTSEHGGDATSWQSRVYTATSIDVDDNISSPAELLHADDAIRVAERVYITLDGMNPNTTYFIRVQPVVKRDGVEETFPSNVTLTGLFVAHTMATGNMCRLDDRVFQEGAVVSQNCREECTCVVGHVTCESACVEEKVMVAPSPACPWPQLTAVNQSCCRTWTCSPPEDGCTHNGMTLRNGEQLYEGTCGRRCTCTNGEVMCTPWCDLVTAAPRTGCVLTNVTGSCCPVWMCPLESEPPAAVSMSARIGFEGVCSDDPAFRVSLHAAVARDLQGRLPCADKGSPLYVACRVKDVTVDCPDESLYRPHSGVVVVVSANVTDSNTTSQAIVSLTATSSALLAEYVSKTVTVTIDGGRRVTSSGTYLSYGVTLVCPEGFAPLGNSCENNNSGAIPPSTGLLRQNVTLTLVNTSHDSATFAWPSLPPHSLTYVTGFVIQFRRMTYTAWNETVTLHPVTTRHTVTYLSSARQYLARLVALTNWTSAPRLALSLVEFTTRYHEVLANPFTLDPLQVSLGLTSATISWTSLSDDVTSAISKLQISFRPSRGALELTFRDLDPRESHVSLVGLDSSTAYVIKFVVLLINGTTITTAPLHFVTVTADTAEIPLLPLLATCVAVIVLSILLPVSYIVWRRMRRKSTAAETAFENRTYGVTVTSLCPITRAKNCRARPQDLENAIGVAGSIHTASSAAATTDARPSSTPPVAVGAAVAGRA